MDSGEVIPGLNEDWTFAGAKAMEWVAGLVMMLVCSELFFTSAGTYMPILMCIWVGTTLSLAGLRKQFPDEERGLRNFVMVKAGFPPPGIPAPATIQPVWSGAPMRALDEKSLFVQLGLGEIFPEEQEEEQR